ncbi:MAG TPA: hypothetical protein QKA37_00030 [Candidatus Megaira endosymbiont of Stentor roeselii]|nr:hypothetical protein [Candidatus Megaera endosymbiont of Stentor roeselii]
MIIRDRFISREEVSKLLWGMVGDISTHSLSMWLKSKTDNEFVVVPREFVYMTVLFFEVTGSEYKDRLSNSQEMLKDLTAIKNYL